MFRDKRFRVQQLDTHQANHQADVPEYSILEYFVHFRLFTWFDIHQANHQADISKYSIFEYLVNFICVKCIL
jgi:hypothetical protein